MIVHRDVTGSEDTAFHTFEITQEGNNIIISEGEFYQNGRRRLQIRESTTISIDLNESVDCQIWATDVGIVTLFGFDEFDLFESREDKIDKLAWFTVPANIMNFDDVEIHVMRTVK